MLLSNDVQVPCRTVRRRAKLKEALRKNGEEKMPDWALHNRAKVALCSLGGKKNVAEK